MDWTYLIIIILGFAGLFVGLVAVYVKGKQRDEANDRWSDVFYNVLGIKEGKSTVLDSLLSFKGDLFKDAGFKSLRELVGFYQERLSIPIEGSEKGEREAINFDNLIMQIEYITEALKPLGALTDAAEKYHIKIEDNTAATDLLTDVFMATINELNGAIDSLKTSSMNKNDIYAMFDQVEKEKPLKELKAISGATEDEVIKLSEDGYGSVAGIPDDETEFVENVSISAKRAKAIHANIMKHRKGGTI